MDNTSGETESLENPSDRIEEPLCGVPNTERPNGDVWGSLAAGDSIGDNGGVLISVPGDMDVR